ncbi:MAG: methylisocitrate lyase [Actinomycetota bacterium]|nr:methylisocitrate lyase [Actinomycetota bacterium]
MANSPGLRLKAAMEAEKPLQAAGAINAMTAIMAERTGFRALYLSGAGVANASFALPDLGITTLNDVLEDARRITSASSLPLIVDADTGWGGAFNIQRTVKQMISASVAAIHIEDQVAAKRCGQRPGKKLVSTNEMVDRIKAAVDAKSDNGFMVIARTDAAAVEGFDAALERACAYRDAGADVLFPEALGGLEQYAKFVRHMQAPVLANMTEFGVAPLYTVQELAGAGVSIILYPLSAFRAMNRAAFDVYRAIRANGTQKDMLAIMQTREELYELLRYYDYERKLDLLYPGGKQ